MYLCPSLFPQKDLFYLKEKGDPDRAKTSFKHAPTCHDVEIFA